MGTNQKRSRRLADRALQIAARQGATHPELEPLVPIVSAAARTLIELYDRRAIGAKLRENVERDADARIAALRERLAAWGTPLDRTLELPARQRSTHHERAAPGTTPPPRCSRPAARSARRH